MKQLTTRYGVRANTIRRWTETCAEYLSPGANPPKGKRRQYTVEDADVIDLIADMRSEDSEIGEILNALEAGKRGQWPRDDYETAEDAPGSGPAELTGKDKLIAELSHRLGVVEGKLELMTEWHENWQERAQIAENKLLLLEAPKVETEPQEPAETPQDAQEPEPAAAAELSGWDKLKRLFGGGGSNE